jgi:poly(A) polymerase
VLYRLREVGYGAYLVGGCVRDMLLGREPKDFDVSTDAKPEEVRAQFRNCRLIGRRFRLAHVHFGREIIEVATFRALHADDAEDSEERLIENGRIIRDNVYGTLEEDAWRRDFTVNALYYNIDDFSVVDYVGGMDDLRAGVLRMIGDAATRYREDPVRMLRAVRFAVKLGFRIHPDTEAPMFELAPLLASISPARLYEEVLKLFLSGDGAMMLEALRHYHLFDVLFPGAEQCLAENRGVELALLNQALANTDARISEGKPVTPAFLYAALLWGPMRAEAARLQSAGMPEALALQQASRDVFQEQSRHAILPRRFSTQTREIWLLQPRLLRNTGKRAARMLEHPRFRAAYDFLLLRAAAGEDVREVAEWWTRFQESDEPGRVALAAPASPTTAVGEAGERRPRRRRRRKPRGKAAPV